MRRLVAGVVALCCALWAGPGFRLALAQTPEAMSA